MSRFKGCIPVLFGLFALFEPLLADKPQGAATGYDLLQKIRSPQDLLFPHFPKQYCVPVGLAGSIADQIRQTLDSMKLEKPNYKERFTGNAFDLYLSNESYSIETRELLAGVLNPVELIKIVVESVLHFRERNGFETLKQETTLLQSNAMLNGRNVHVIKLSPRGDRFSYTYQDMGAFIQESWCLDLTIILDKVLHTVYEVSIKKSLRRTDASRLDKPPITTSITRYFFTYEFQNGIPRPRQLVVQHNNDEILKIEARYRQQGKYLVFDRKEICTMRDGHPDCLAMNYGEYRFDDCHLAAPKFNSNQSGYTKRLQESAQLSKSANKKLRAGKISECIRLLNDITDRYGDTPQAIEARRLLGKIPAALQ